MAKSMILQKSTYLLSEVFLKLLLRVHISMKMFLKILRREIRALDLALEEERWRWLESLQKIVTLVQVNTKFPQRKPMWLFLWKVK